MSARDAFALLMGAAAAAPAGGSKRKRPADEDDEVVVLDDEGGAAAAAAPPARPQPASGALGGGGGGGIGAGRTTRRLLLVRHGATRGYHLRDTPLSDAGRAQARGLLESHPALRDVQAVVVSLLTRALLTAQLGFGSHFDLQPRALPGAAAAAAAAAAGAVPSAAAGTAAGGAVTALAGVHSGGGGGSGGRPALPVYVTPLARERLATLGDAGTDWRAVHRQPGPPRCAGELVPLLPWLAEHVPPGWWAAHHDGRGGGSPGGAPSPAPGALQLPADAPRESAEALRRRVAALRNLLRALPHDRVAA